MQFLFKHHHETSVGPVTGKRKAKPGDSKVRDKHGSDSDSSDDMVPPLSQLNSLLVGFKPQNENERNLLLGLFPKETSVPFGNR